jgi:hypothetical protein
MRKLIFILIVGAVAVIAVWYVVRISGSSNAAVAALVPRETILLVHVPDFSRTRDRWHHSDLYELYREPAVQDFLRKPLSRLPKRDSASRTLQDVEELDPKDAFFALTSSDKSNPRFAGGFRFRGSEQSAEGIIGKWRSKLLEKNPNAKRATIEYERHKIDTVAIAPFTFASSYDGHWFFFSNDLAELKALLDRADQRSRDRQATLDGDESYRAAMAHMPSAYAALFYLQPKTFAEQLQSLRAAIGSPVSPNERTLLEQLRSVCGTVQFDGGKIHDVLFVGMPKLEKTPALTRSSLGLGTKDTVFYLAMLLNLGPKIDMISQTSGIGDRIQKLFQTFSDNGITADDWKAGFGPELGTFADWPGNTHWPSLLLTLPVIEIGKASKIVEAVMRADEDSAWARTEKDGVRYFSMQSPASFIPIAPTIALSDRVMIAGLDAGSVETAIKRSRSSDSELSDTQSYKSAARLVPPPTNFFTYLDTALLYTRLDTTLRPLVLMAAAFMPGVSDYVDLDKFPATEVITKHLSPIVSSQRYEHDGYVAESVGPVTLNQAGIGFAALGIGVANSEKARGGLGSWAPSLPSPSPSTTP